jgi:hypothetical protein
MGVAAYLESHLGLPLSELSSALLREKSKLRHDAAKTVKIWRSRGEGTKMVVYEGGPGTTSHRPPAADEVRKNSMIAAATYLDNAAELFEQGVVEYNFFTYQNNAAWQATTGSSSRFHLPVWYATAMFNRCCADGVQVETKGVKVPILISNSNPGLEKGMRPEEMPAVSVRTYVRAALRSFLLLNRNPGVTYPVSLKTGDDGVSYHVTELAAGAPERGTLEGLGLLEREPPLRNLEQIKEVVYPQSVEVRSKDGSLFVDLKPASIVTVQPVAGEPVPLQKN